MQKDMFMEYGQLIMSGIVVAGYIILLATGNPHASDLKDLVSAVVIFYLGSKVGASMPNNVTVKTETPQETVQ